MKTNRKAIWGWALYDWANSAFATTVMAGFFPIFFKQFWSSGADVNVSTAQLGFGNSIASLMVALMAPILGAIAGVVVLNVGGFIGRGECEGYCTEKHNIQTAVIASCTENGTHADYESYLIGDTMFTWAPTGCGAVPDAGDAPDGCDCLND